MMYLLLLLLSSTMIIAMDENFEQYEQIVEKQSQEIIKGVLVLHPHESIVYSLIFQERVRKALNVEIKDSDPLVSVRAFKDNGASKTPIYFGKKFTEFPELLPLSLLVGKKEGDRIEFVTEDVKIMLTCTQKPHTQKSAFETQLKHLVNKFKNHPHYHLFDEEELIKKGIMVSVKDRYKHGPNGYKFS